MDRATAPAAQRGVQSSSHWSWLASLPVPRVCSLPPSPPSFGAISCRVGVTQSQSNGPALEGCSENEHTEGKASLGSSGAQCMGPCWFQSIQSLYSGSANNRPFRGNEGTVNPEVMNKKKHLFTQFASRNSVSYDVAKGRDLWDQTTAEPALGIAIVQTKK